MDSDIERQIWSLAAQVYGESLESMLRMALADYRRRPGLQDLTRLYPSCVGTAAYHSLESALLGGRYASSVAVGHLGLRTELRWFLRRHLQQSLIQTQHATGPMIDNYFSTDLGL